MLLQLLVKKALLDRVPAILWLKSNADIDSHMGKELPFSSFSIEWGGSFSKDIIKQLDLNLVPLISSDEIPSIYMNMPSINGLTDN